MSGGIIAAEVKQEIVTEPTAALLAHMCETRARLGTKCLFDLIAAYFFL